MTPNPQPSAPRHFYRCADCLTVAAVDQLATGARCGLCDGRCDYMGRVQQARLVKDSIQCKCDDRCTHARGPVCNCKCGGKYHGQGMLAPVDIVTRDRGPVPVIKMPTSEKAKRTAAEWRAAVAHLQEQLATLMARRDANGRLDAADYLLALKLQNVVRKSRAARVHSHRLALIYDVIGRPAVELPAMRGTISGPIRSTGPRRQLSLID